MIKSAISAFFVWSIFTIGYAQKKESYRIDAHFKSPDFRGDQVPVGLSQVPVILPDGKLLVITQKFDYVDGKHLSGNTLRLNRDGSHDTTFKVAYIYPIYEISASKVFPDGRTVIIPDAKYSSIPQIVSFNNRGVDTVYKAKEPYFIYGLGIQSEGKIVLLNLVSDPQKFELRRLLGDGTPDTTFRFAQEKFDDNSSFLGIDADDNILISGAKFDTITVRAFTKDGQLKTKFPLRQNDKPFSSTALDIAQLSAFPDGKIFVKDKSANTYYIFSAEGRLETTYVLPQGVKTDHRKSILLADGAIIESTQKMPYKINTATNEIKPLLRDSTLIDPAYGYQVTPLEKGNFLLSNYVNDLIWVDSTGKILRKSTVRLNRSGVKAIRAMLKNDRILVDVQKDARSDLYRLHKNGSVDSTFIFQTKKITQPAAYTSNRSFLANNIMDLYSLNDGSLLINLSPEWDSLPKTFRIKADGSIDDRFLRTDATTLPLPEGLFLIKPWNRYNQTNKSWIVNNEGQPVNPQNAFQQFVLKDNFDSYRLLKDGRVLVKVVGTQSHVFSRLLADGTADPSFDLVDQTLHIKGVQNDGKLLMGTDYQEELKRFNSDGSRDSAFKGVLSTDGWAPNIYTTYLQADQKIVIFGRFGNYNKFMRLNTDGSADSTFIIPKELNLDLIGSIQPVSDQEILIVYKGRIERLVLRECNTTPPQISASKTQACTNESVELKVIPVQGISYQWQKEGKELGLTETTVSIKAPMSGSYKVMATDPGCGMLSSNELTVAFTPVPNAQIVKITPVFGSGAAMGSFSMILEANAGPDWNYQWQKDSVDVNGATNLKYEVKEPGYYRVKVSNNGCNQISPALFIHISPGLLGSKQEDLGSSLGVFPNPTTGTFSLDLPQELAEGKVELFDMLGRPQPFSRQAGYFQTQLNKGVYLIRVSQGTKTATAKVMIE